MSQSDILTCLERAKNGLTAHQLAAATGIGYSSITTNLRKMRDNDDVDWVVGHHKSSPRVYYYYLKGRLQKNARGKK